MKNLLIIKILKFLIEPFFIIFCHIISYIIPKNRNMWCFGAWFGNKYADNSKYLYEAMKEDDEINCYWITNNKTLYNQLIKEDSNVLLSKSLQGILVQLRSYVFVATVNSKDFYFPLITRKNYFVQLWHGAPMKKIGFDVKHKSKIAYFINIIRYFMIDNYNVIISPGKIFDEIFSSSMKICKNNVVRSQLPRCDGLKLSNSTRNSIRKKYGVRHNEIFILYLPTHRNEGKDVKEIEKILSDFNNNFHIENIKIIFSLHPYDKKFIKEIKNKYQKINIIDENDDIDIYNLLGASDGLISDYSSVVFDYAVLNKPILLYMPDLKNYIKKERDFYFDLKELPFPIFYKYEKLEEKISEIDFSEKFIFPQNDFFTTNDNNISNSLAIALKNKILKK